MTPQKLLDRGKQWLHGILGDEKKTVDLLVALGAAGILLLAVSEWLPASKPAKETELSAAEDAITDDREAYETRLEKRLCELLAQVDGAGRVEVMVTLATGEETVYATDSETDAAGQTKQHVLLEDAAVPALVETVHAPAVQGVAVVCDGGADPLVESDVTQIVCTLTGIGANRVSVAAMARDADR